MLQFDFLGTDHVYLQGCDFIGSGAYYGSVHQGSIDHCNFYGEYQDNSVAICTLQSGGNVSLTNNTAQNYSDSNPAAGRFFYLVGGAGSWGNVYIGNNSSYNMAPSPTQADQNAGEQILWESGNAFYTGRATGGGPNTINLPIGGTNYGGGAYSVVIEAGKGVGQHRLISADNGSGTLTVSQPWNVVPDSSSLVVVLFFNHGYCYGNNLQGRADYATRITASTGFEPYSGVTDVVFDSNTISNCRQGVSNFSIMDKAVGLQPTYLMTCIRNSISNCLWGILTYYTHGTGSSSQGASAIFGSTYAYNVLSSMNSGAFTLGSFDSVGNPGTVDLTTIDHNCALPPLPPASKGPGTPPPGGGAGAPYLPGSYASSNPYALTYTPTLDPAPNILSATTAPNPVTGNQANLAFQLQNQAESLEVNVYTPAYTQVSHQVFNLNTVPG